MTNVSVSVSTTAIVCASMYLRWYLDPNLSDLLSASYSEGNAITHFPDDHVFETWEYYILGAQGR
jgi:hypothetical protein